MDKEDVARAHTHTHTRNGILLSHKENEILPFATTWMNPKGILLSEVTQRKTNKRCMFSLTCEIKKKINKTNK